MEAPPIERVETRKTGHQLVDLILSVCAILISALSIFLAYYTGDSMEQLVHANSWPALQLTSGNSGDRGAAIGFRVLNAGVGPARIHSLDYLVDGRPLPRNGDTLASIVSACCAEAFQAARHRVSGDDHAALGGNGSAPVARSFLPAGKDVGALTWPRTEANAELWRVVDDARFQRRITMRACYCSVFDECWVAETNTFPPRPVKNCKAHEEGRVR